MPKRSIPTLVALAALIGAVAVAAIAQAGDDQSPEPDGIGAGQVTAIEPAAKQAAAVLERPRTGSDALPEVVAEQLDERADFGMNPDLSRRAIGGTSSVFLLPADGHVCGALTYGDRAALHCPKTQQLVEGDAGPGTVTLPGDAIGVYGLVPDGVDVVTLAYDDGESRALEVSGNAYLAALPAGTPVGSVSYDGPSGPVEFPIYDPATVGTPEGE